MVRFARSGGEANAIAVRIARSASSKKKNIAFCGYHGWHDWYLSANLKSKNKKGVLKDHLLEGLSTEGVPKGLKNTVFPFKYNDFESLNITDIDSKYLEKTNFIYYIVLHLIHVYQKI